MIAQLRRWALWVRDRRCEALGHPWVTSGPLNHGPAATCARCGRTWGPR